MDKHNYDNKNFDDLLKKIKKFKEGKTCGFVLFFNLNDQKEHSKEFIFYKNKIPTDQILGVLEIVKQKELKDSGILK